MLIITPKLQMEIERYGEREYPNECCGALWGEVSGERKIIKAIRPMENVYEVGRQNRFRIDSRPVFQLLKEERNSDQRLIGFYHSHPNHPATPSEEDRYWAFPWYSYIIISMLDGLPTDLRSWTLKDDQSGFEPEPVYVE